MSKYIIEIKPEYEDKFKGVMILGAENSNLYVDSNTVDELEELTADYINEHFGSLQDDAYKRGLEDGKAVNDKGCEGCLYNDGTKEHSPCDICCNAYLNRWTAKQTDEAVKRGDVVRHKINGLTYIVTLASDCGYVLLGDDGNFATSCITSAFEKTGKHFDIDKILKEMKGGNDK